MSTNWQENAEGDFEKIKQGSPSSFWSSGLQRRLELTQKFVDFKGNKVLDVGCGTGMFLGKFKELGAEVYGIDVDEDKVRIAKEKYVNVMKAPAEDLPYKDKFFDIVWSHEVLEHVDNDRKAIQESIRVLKPGGKLVVFCPNKLWPFETHGIYLGNRYIFGNIPFVPWSPYPLYDLLTPHVRNYSNKKLEELFRNLPVQIVTHTHIFPGFDQIKRRSRILSKIVKAILYPLENTPLHNFGLSHFLIVEKK